MTTLKEVHEITEKLHKGKTVIHLNVAIDAAIILANRVEELEAEAKEQKYVLRRAKYTHKNRLIKQIEQRTEARIRELEAQRDELVRAALGVLKIAQSTYHSDDRGPGDLCSILENAIEKATGGKWWNVIKASDRKDMEK